MKNTECRDKDMKHQSYRSLIVKAMIVIQDWIAAFIGKADNMAPCKAEPNAYRIFAFSVK